ncbi:MAG TPA: hypothetical protein VEA69_02715 [Tepidisphaeraceae bacterium]|nr:hypothetical protein [Tepidisphaeraceae bacterium]
MELNEALSQITEIRRQMARAGLFRGYRSVTAAFSGCVAIVAACLQSVLVPMPHRNTRGFMFVWLAAAVVSLVAAAVHMIVRCRRADSPLQKDLTVLAAEQFAPCLAGGALLTIAMNLFAREHLFMLPVCWAVLFSMGVFASRQVLPRAITIVGGYYMLAGLVALAVTASESGDHALLFSPWTMGTIFGVGQFLAAGVLYWTLERDPARRD